MPTVSFQSQLSAVLRMNMKRKWRHKVATLFELGKIATPASREFAAAYRAKYGRAPTWVAAYGYDSVVELAKAVEAAKFNPSKMRDYFKDRKTEGAIGSMEFDRTADPLSELELTRL